MKTTAIYTLAILFTIAHGFQLNQPIAVSKLSNQQQLHQQSSHSRTRCNLSMRWGLKAGGSANKPTGNLPDGVALRDTVPFELRGFSLPLVVFSVGVVLTLSSFAGFFLDDGGSGGAVSSLGFVYGIPVFLIGLSLWYAEIPPAELITDAGGDRAWETHSTDTLKKIKQDVTRHRYGDDAHLDSTLDSLGLKLPQKKYPKLQTLIQEETDKGQLAFTMIFQSAETPYKVWKEPTRVRRFTKFFGPNVFAEVSKVDAEKRLVALKLTTVTEEEYQNILDSPLVEATVADADDDMESE